MSCKFKYKGEVYTEKALLEKLSSDPVVMAKYFPQEERPMNDYTREDMKIFKAKVEFFQDRMDVKVILDPTVDSSRLLGKNDARVQAAGKPVILINPDQLFTTTAIHEFGHVFIDAFPGGMKNPRLQRAYEMLAESPLYAEIKELYPELTDEMFQKELIVTAMGREGAQIWGTGEKLSTWESIKSWFMDFVRRTFGIERDTIQGLVREMVVPKKKRTYDIQEGSMTDQDLRLRKRTKEKQEDKAKVKTLENVYNEMVARVTNIYNEYRPSNPLAWEKENLNREERITRFQSIETLNEALSKLDKADRQLGLAKYIEWVNDEISILNKTTDDRIRQGNLTDDKVMKSMNWNQGFSMIEDIQKLVIVLEKDGDLTAKDKKYYDRKLSDLQGKRSKIEAKLLQAARESYARYMSENDNKIRVEYEELYAKEFDEQEMEGSGITKDQYIMQQLELNKDTITEEAYIEALDRAEKSVSDISTIAARFWSEKNANSQDIQVLSTMVDAVESEIQAYSLTKATKFDEDNKAYKDNVSNAYNQKEKYKGLYEISTSGQTYYASQYKGDFIEEKRKLYEQAFMPERAEEAYGDIEIKGDALFYTSPLTGKKESIKFGDASKFRLEGKHVSYELIGDRVHITKEEAIGRAEYEKWLDSNTESVIVKGKEKYVPIQKWVNESYNSLSAEQKKHLDVLKEEVREADDLFKSKDSLITRTFNQEFIRVPGVLKSDLQRFSDGDIVGGLKHQLSELTSVQKDDFETETNATTSKAGTIKTFADISNREKLRVPIPFRARLNEAEQSFDLHTITLMNTVAAKNYEKKKEIEDTFLVVLEVMKNRKVPDKHGIMGLQKVHALNPDVEVGKNLNDGLPNDVIKSMDTLRGRIYGIKSNDAGEVKFLGKKADVNKLTKTWLKYSGTVALVGNWVNSVVNLNMGTINNMIEAMGGEHFTWSDWMYGGKTYWKDIKNIQNDWGSNVDKSRTNMMMQVFNVMGDKQYLDNNFEENDRAKALLKMNSLRPIAKAGEHMMQAKVMYATLHHIKAMNAKGEYLDVDGNVTTDKKKAAGLDQMIQFNDAKGGGIEMALHPSVAATTFTKSGGQKQILLEAKNLVKYKVRELHGNYDADIQAAAQKEFWGKLLYFLRKWVEEGYFRRWRGTGTIFKKHEDLQDADRFYSQDAKGDREGYYVTATRFVSRVLLPGIRQMNLELIKKGAGNLNAHEKANIRKLAFELGSILLMVLAYASMDDDDDETLMTRYLMRRQIAELSFFMMPTEAVKIASTPTAAIGTVKRISQAFVQAFDPGASYEAGANKGRSKLWVKMLKTMPITSQTERDVKSALSFMESISF